MATLSITPESIHDDFVKCISAIYSVLELLVTLFMPSQMQSVEIIVEIFCEPVGSGLEN
ncbi:hypothetical protein K7432_018355 [Basidiobolus ranarum]|uniref:Uncharacterized protein n=1 Tax=Basidiobolus ranarum TaxID=34480 RepID=A0ABR2WCA7_9FUNG